MKPRWSKKSGGGSYSSPHLVTLDGVPQVLLLNGAGVSSVLPADGITLWENAWAEFTPFLQFSPEIRKIVCSTNAIESLNARFRQAARRRGHFPTEQAAMKVLYLVVQQKRRGGGSITGRVYGWAKALNALILAYGDRITI